MNAEQHDRSIDFTFFEKGVIYHLTSFDIRIKYIINESTDDKIHDSKTLNCEGVWTEPEAELVA